MSDSYDFSNAKRGAVLPHAGETRIAIWIDNDVLSAFREKAERECRGYQNVIKDALRVAAFQKTANGENAIKSRVWGVHEEVGSSAEIECAKPLLEMASEGARGAAYLYFSSEQVATTEPWEEHDEVVIDYAADSSVVGVELVSICPETIAALGKVACRFDLDLGGLFARPITPYVM